MRARLFPIAAVTALAAAIAAAGCGRAPEAASAAGQGDGVVRLERCEQRLDADLRAYECGELTAVESIVLAASERDLQIAFDQFAAAFGGTSPRRVDSVYTSGEARHTWMRLESTTPAGAVLEAQMVAVVRGSGVRLVTCRARAPGAKCGPVVASLVLGRE